MIDMEVTHVPFVSVLLPVYNGASFVRRAIESIRDQTFLDWELIILDDCSIDGSFELCQSIASESPQIRLFRNQKNIGLAGTMNRLVSYSKGTYLAVQEQDDISLPYRLQMEVELLRSNPEIGVISGIAAWFRDDGIIFTHFPGLLQRKEQYPQSRDAMVRYLFIDQCKVVNAACMFRRELIELIPGPFDPDARMSIDWQFFIHAAHHTCFWGISEVLVNMYRGQDKPHLSSDKQLQFSEARRCIKKIYHQYKKDDQSPINWWLYRQAMSSELVLEGRYFGSLKGVMMFSQALWYNPSNSKGWESLNQLIKRGLIKVFATKKQ
jgi:glycosyltransferase involved in cell wall biosynthesis